MYTILPTYQFNNNIQTIVFCTLTFQSSPQLHGKLVEVHLLQDGQHLVPNIFRAVHLHHHVHSVVSVGLIQLFPWHSDLVLLMKVAPKPLKFARRKLFQSVPQHFLQVCDHCGVWILVHD